MSVRSKAEEALQNPNVQLFLDLLAEAEGASKGYRTLFGGSTIEDLSDHPRKFQEYYNSRADKIERTSAAGRYQFKQDSWDEQAKRLGLTDFSPKSQDLAAIGLMMYKPKVFEALKAGDFDTAIKGFGSFWASLPSSPHNQPHRSQAWVNEKMQELQGRDLRAQHLAMAGEPVTPRVPGAAPANPRTPEPWQGVPFAVPTVELSPFEGIPPSTDQRAEWQQLLDSVGQTNPMLNSLDAQPEIFADPLVQAGIDADANRARNEAVAAFTGNPVQQDISLPKALDASIRKLLVDL